MKKIITVFVALTFALSCFFTSCTNLADSFTPAESENASYSISGTITGLGFDGQKSESNSRTAFPDLSDAGTVSYKITAVKTGASPVTATCNSSTPTFTLKIPSAGIWTVKAEGFNAGSKKILSTIEYTVDISNLSPSAAVNLEAKPIVTEDGAGTISLSFGTSLLSLGITTVEVHGDDLGLDVMKLDCTRDGITTQTGKTLKSGSYVVDIDFYKTSGGNNDLCYSCTQVINVYDGLTTNTWVKHGNEPYLEYKTGGSQTPGSAADFKLTDALLKQFELSSFYVDTAANESGTGVLGSWLNPYDNFDDAYEAVETAFINGLKNATIFVKGKASDEYKVIVNKPIKNNASESLTIKSWDIEHRAVLTRGVGTDFEDDSFITNLCPLTLQNLILDGDNKLDGLGCIYTYNTTLELTNVEIRNFFAKNYESDPERCSKGGGIYIQDGNVTLNNVLIENCSVEYPSDYTPAGGAIYVAGGSLTITGETVIKDNYFAKKKTTASGTVLENGSKSNVYLKGTNVMSISNTGTGSRIGVTKAFASATANTVQFATDTTTALADKYFSDEGYLLTNVSNKANIARSSGTLTGGVYQDVKFEFPDTEYYFGEVNEIEITPKLGTSEILMANPAVSVYYAGSAVTSTVTDPTSENKKYKVTLSAKYPAGTYYIVVSGTYNGLTYSGTKAISVIDTNIRRFTTANIESVNMSKYAGKTLEFVLDSTVSQKQVYDFCENISKLGVGAATIDLNLSAVTTVKKFDADYSRRNIRKIILPDNLESFNASEQKNRTGYDVQEVEISDTNSNFKTIDGVLFNNDCSVLIYYPYVSTRKTYTLPTTVKTIGTHSFMNTSGLETLICPNVNSIIKMAFWNASIKHIVFTSTSSITLEEESFVYLRELEDMTFYTATPPTLNKSSSYQEFYKCDKLTKIYVPRGSKNAYKTDSTWSSSSINYLRNLDALLEEF